MINPHSPAPTGQRTLRIYRGIPGSGKSTAAKQWTDTVIEADNFPSRYLPDGTLNPAIPHSIAFRWVRVSCEKAMLEGVEKIALANTFIRLHWLAEWFDLAALYGYRVEVVDCTGDYGSIHNVPVEVLERMRSEFELWEGDRA